MPTMDVLYAMLAGTQGAAAHRHSGYGGRDFDWGGTPKINLGNRKNGSVQGEKYRQPPERN
jgi:hypothetical protein